ncbi:MAG: OsmC family protein [Acidimicrobiales bacterium]|nr:OsmC family protein [Acidimicrobiales bacterium]
MTDGTHVYRTRLAWAGSTAVGYDAYDRRHEISAPPAAAPLDLSADPSFRGDPLRLNPELLLVAAASSCQLLSFLAVAARARIDVVDYQDEAEAFMPAGVRPMSITRIELRPHITIAAPAPDARGVSDARLGHLCEVAHRECYIANSVRSEVVVTPTFVRLG